MAERVDGPVAGTELAPAFVESIARLAYVWGWPMVSQLNRRTALTSVDEPGLRGGSLPNAPAGQVCMMTDYIPADQRFVACTNQDVAYGMGFARLDEDPVVVQIPDFGDRFWVTAAWDHRTDSFARLGKQYGTKPGFYLLAGPHWDGQKPDGISAVFQSPTELAALCPRVFLNDTAEDRAALREVISQLMLYPLSQYDGTMKTTDWSAVPTFPVPEELADGEIHWVDPATFFDQFPSVLKTVPPLPGEEALYALFRSMLEACGQDPALREVLQQAAAETELEVISRLLQWRLNGPPAGNGWYSPVNNSRFGTDYMTRTALARSNMYENSPEETKYVFTDDDSTGKPLHGSTAYAITFAEGQLPPVNGFWSMTLYNEHHFFHDNPLGRYSLGTKNNTLTYEGNSLILYAGAASPGPEHEANWLPAPRGPFSLYIRGYWPGQAMIDGTWQPPAITPLSAKLS